MLVLQAVVQCLPAQVETAKTMLKASNKPHSVLLIEFAKDRKPEDRKSDTSNLRQRVPVKAGYFVRFADSFVHQVTSDGLDAAKPKGLTTAAKVIAKDATVLYVKVPQDFIAAEAWKKFGSSPRAQVAQWAALHRVQLVDAFKWTEEVLPGNRRQIFGVIKISTADAPTLLAQSDLVVSLFKPPGKSLLISMCSGSSATKMSLAGFTSQGLCDPKKPWD